MQAGGLLLGDEFGDRLVLDRLERCGIDFAGGEILTRGLELGRAEIGACLLYTSQHTQRSSNERTNRTRHRIDL